MYLSICLASCTISVIIISRLKRGKAADIAGVSAEHLLHSDPSVDLVLCKLFNVIMKRGYVPSGFRYSYIVPLPKIKDCRSKKLTCDDFRGIAISPVISKVFEHCLLDRIQTFLQAAVHNMVAKKDSGVEMLFTVFARLWSIILLYNSTVNICAIDLAKAFDKTNHSMLYETHGTANTQ